MAQSGGHGLGHRIDIDKDACKCVTIKSKLHGLFYRFVKLGSAWLGVANQKTFPRTLVGVIKSAVA